MAISPKLQLQMVDFMLMIACSHLLIKAAVDTKLENFKLTLYIVHVHVS